MNRFRAICLVALGAGCRVNPHDASIAAHEAAAREAEQAAVHHEDLAVDEPNQPQTHVCTDDADSPACWSLDERVREHKRQAEFLRAAAAAHREASRALRLAERESCEGLSADERDISPFFHTADIASVGLMDQSVEVGFRPVPGLDEARLRRHVRCHLARNASLGHDVPEMSYCLLVPRDVAATVESTSNGLRVIVEGTTRDAAKELRARGLRLRDRVRDRRARAHDPTEREQ